MSSHADDPSDAGLILHRPPDVHSLAAAEEAAELYAAYRHPLDEDQALTVEVAMGERADGSWAASEVGDFKGRQAGKGDSIECRELSGLLLFGDMLQLHTAHEFPTANEAFLRMSSLFENYDDLRKRVARIRYANGEQGVELKTGQRLKYKARTGGGGRGFAGADLVILDEAQHLRPEHLAAIGPTITARPNAQVWIAGSGGLEMSSEARRFRHRALSNNGGRLGYTERTAEHVTRNPDGSATLTIPAIDDPLDHELLMSHPGYASGRVDREMFETLLRLLGREMFIRECLCIWMPEPNTDHAGPITLDTWESLTDATSTVTADTAHVAVDKDSDWYQASVAGERPDGLIHIGTLVANMDRKTFLTDLVEACKALGVTTVTLPKGSPAEALAADLERHGLDHYLMPPAEQAMAFEKFVNATKGAAPMLRHRGEPKMRQALEQAAVKPWGDGGQTWSRRAATGDIAPLAAPTMAYGRLGVKQEDSAFVSVVIGG